MGTTTRRSDIPEKNPVLVLVVFPIQKPGFLGSGLFGFFSRISDPGSDPGSNPGCDPGISGSPFFSGFLKFLSGRRSDPGFAASEAAFRDVAIPGLRSGFLGQPAGSRSSAGSYTGAIDGRY